MSKNNKLALGAIGAILVVVGIYSMSGKSNQKMAADTTKQVAPQQQTAQNDKPIDLKAQSSDFLVDFFVDGLAQEEYTTTNEKIDSSFTPYQLEASGAITTNF